MHVSETAATHTAVMSFGAASRPSLTARKATLTVKPSGRTQRLLQTAALGIASATLVGGCSETSDAPEDPCRFDPVAWQTLHPDDRREGDEKAQMADAVMTCNLLTGATRDRVAELLGKANHPFGTEDVWEYTLRPEKFGVDYELLVIRFNTEGTVSEVSIGQS